MSRPEKIQAVIHQTNELLEGVERVFLPRPAERAKVVVNMRASRGLEHLGVHADVVLLQPSGLQISRPPAIVAMQSREIIVPTRAASGRDCMQIRDYYYDARQVMVNGLRVGSGAVHYVKFDYVLGGQAADLDEPAGLTFGAVRALGSEWALDATYFDEAFSTPSSEQAVGRFLMQNAFEDVVERPDRVPDLLHFCLNRVVAAGESAS